MRGRHLAAERWATSSFRQLHAIHVVQLHAGNVEGAALALRIMHDAWAVVALGLL